MAKTQTETFIRRSVVDALRRAGWFVIYNMQMGFGQHRGLADLTCMKDGQVIFVEIKTAVGKQSPDQVQFQKDCEAHGVTYILARTTLLPLIKNEWRKKEWNIKFTMKNS